jgi:hypothetical protein
MDQFLSHTTAQSPTTPSGGGFIILAWYTPTHHRSPLTPDHRSVSFSASIGIRQNLFELNFTFTPGGRLVIFSNTPQKTFQHRDASKSVQRLENRELTYVGRGSQLIPFGSKLQTNVNGTPPISNCFKNTLVYT